MIDPCTFGAMFAVLVFCAVYSTTTLSQILEKLKEIKPDEKETPCPPT